MKRWMIAAAVSFCAAWSSAALAAGNPGDTGDFELTAVAPPTPVLKYHLLFNYAERREGNAAVPNLTATELVGMELTKKVDAAEDAYEQKRDDFKTLAQQADSPAIIALLDLAGRCDQCDWQVPVREQGGMAMLPYLQSERALANLVRVRALTQLQDGNVDDSLASIRLGYELGRNVAQSPTLVSGLVGVGIVAWMDETLKEEMSRPDAANLYWALASLPHPMFSFSRNMDAEGGAWATGSMPELAGKSLDDLSAEQWHRIFKRAAELSNADNNKPGAAPSQAAWANEQTVADEVTHTLPEAQDDYAKRYGVPADQVEQLDKFKVVCTFWYQQYVNLAEAQSALTTLPYAIVHAKIDDTQTRVVHLRQSEPANVFLEWIAAPNRVALTFVKIERTTAAMTDVEAIRSYAAAHGGALPAQLGDITDTPVLDNPYTGKPFEYQVQNGVATLADSKLPEYPLKYTIRIRN